MRSKKQSISREKKIMLQCAEVGKKKWRLLYQDPLDAGTKMNGLQCSPLICSIALQDSCPWPQFQRRNLGLSEGGC